MRLSHLVTMTCLLPAFLAPQAHGQAASASAGVSPAPALKATGHSTDCISCTKTAPCAPHCPNAVMPGGSRPTEPGIKPGEKPRVASKRHLTPNQKILAVKPTPDLAAPAGVNTPVDATVPALDLKGSGE